jgi:multidrug efflux pump subunit AcrB
LRDIATLSRGLSESPSSIYHANGRQAVTMGVSFIPGVNVIDVGRALESKAGADVGGKTGRDQN